MENGPFEKCNRIEIERLFLEEGGIRNQIGRTTHALECARCRNHLLSLFRERQTFLGLRPFSSFRAKYLEKVVSSPWYGLNPRSQLGMLGMASSLVFLAMFLPITKFKPVPQADQGMASEVVRLKGPVALGVKIKRNSLVLDPDSTYAYRLGDTLQFFYEPGRNPIVNLVSLDASGQVTVYKTGRGIGSFNISAKPGRTGMFPFSVQLDDSPGNELFMLTASRTPMDEDTVKALLTNAFAENAGKLLEVERHLASRKTNGVVRIFLMLPKEPL